MILSVCLSLRIMQILMNVLKILMVALRHAETQLEATLVPVVLAIA